MSRVHATAAVARPRVGGAPTASAPPRPKAERRSKRCRSPCEDELRYRALAKEKQEVQQRVQRQLEALAGLEDNILEFYYTHMLRYEPLLQASTAPEAAAPSSASPALSSFTELFPEQLESDTAPPPLAQTATVTAPLVVPPKTRYYYNSTLMRLYREAALQERAFAREYTAEEARVVTLEQHVRTDIVGGSLAAQLSTERAAQDALNTLSASLAELRTQCADHDTTINGVEARIAATDAATEACHGRMAVLEAKKKEQMDNAEKIKEEVAAFRRTVDACVRELEKRKQINQSLEEEIARRRAMLRRRRKEA